MKKFYFLMAGVCLYFTTLAQTDSTDKKDESQNRDTIRIGNIIIIRTPGKHKEGDDTSQVQLRRRRSKPGNVSTNWAIVDLGFNNYTDNTNYASGGAQQFAPGANKDRFNLRNGKSVNVNIWAFMQRLNVIKRVVNLKYGLGVELNNYRYEENIRFTESPTMVYKDTIQYSKNKLAADYLTVPVMISFNLTPGKENNKSFGFSVGASGGYLYSSRQKFVSSSTGKQKVKDDFDLRPFKISYIAELQLGPVKLYGSLATKSIFEKGLDQTPYNIGVRFSNW